MLKIAKSYNSVSTFLYEFTWSVESTEQAANTSALGFQRIDFIQRLIKSFSKCKIIVTSSIIVSNLPGSRKLIVEDWRTLRDG